MENVTPGHPKPETPQFVCCLEQVEASGVGMKLTGFVKIEKMWSQLKNQEWNL